MAGLSGTHDWAHARPTMSFVNLESPPVIIQGGMGAGVSGWRLARAVAEAGQVGVVSGTAIDLLVARRLQDGDPGGHMRRGLAAFPLDGVADRILERYFIEGGKAEEDRFKTKPMPAVEPSRHLEDGSSPAFLTST